MAFLPKEIGAHIDDHGLRVVLACDGVGRVGEAPRGESRAEGDGLGRRIGLDEEMRVGVVCGGRAGEQADEREGADYGGSHNFRPLGVLLALP